MKNLSKEDCVFILSSLIDSKLKDYNFLSKMPLQENKVNNLKNEINNLDYVRNYIESN